MSLVNAGNGVVSAVTSACVNADSLDSPVQASDLRGIAFKAHAWTAGFPVLVKVKWHRCCSNQVRLHLEPPCGKQLPLHTGSNNPRDDAALCWSLRPLR